MKDDAIPSSPDPENQGQSANLGNESVPEPNPIPPERKPEEPKRENPTKVKPSPKKGTSPPVAVTPPGSEPTDEERKKIVSAYRRILRSAAEVLKPGDIPQIKKAFELAMAAHGGVRRKSGELYIFHPLEVARICVEEIGLGATSIICALLHDVVEDTDYSLADIEGMFGTKVAKIIDGLTKIQVKAIKLGEQNASEQAENYKKMLLTISEDIRVVLVKIADRLHNMRTLDSMTREKQLKIKSETEFIYAPLAHRFGLYNIKSELEDLCLKFSDEEAYNTIVQNIKKTEHARKRFVKEFVRPIEEKLLNHGFKFTIKHRVKAVHSIYAKMKKQNISFDEVFDLFAIRIIVDEPEPEKEKSDCWYIYSVITDFYTPNHTRMRDWVSTPKSNGYESLHITVMGPVGQQVEVQIRTTRMDAIAEKGVAAHWKYKQRQSGGTMEQGIEEWLKKVRETLESKDLNALEFVDNFRRDLFADEVFVFTPKGDLRKFPAGATVLDFAFDIHTEVGMRCAGAKVNGQMVPFSQVLRNGDQVEIITSNKARVGEAWLRYVTTSRARAKIKEFLREESRRLNLGAGKEIVLRKLAQLGLEPTPQVYTELMQYFGLKTEADLLIQIGKGQIDHTEIKRAFEPKAKAEVKEPIQEVKPPARPEKKPNNEIIIGGKDDRIQYTLSSCCNPIPGDEIFGITSVSRGIRIHRASCPNAVNIMARYGNRIVPVKWASATEVEFDVSIQIMGTDRMGLVSDVTKVISNLLKINIISLSFDTKAGVFEGNITLAVRDSAQLDKMLEQLNSIEGVVRVIRQNL
ncbi:MAG: RelA/SpoT family protein [Bernardetiaceae bacterium]|jgi:GTP pyrophosphokinase|nr:RelA/SpoT family protein [Bernardetiaceae bacterium]